MEEGDASAEADCAAGGALGAAWYRCPGGGGGRATAGEMVTFGGTTGAAEDDGCAIAARFALPPLSAVPSRYKK